LLNTDLLNSGNSKLDLRFNCFAGI